MSQPPVQLPPSRPPLRGSPKRKTDFMEALQQSYVRAVAAAAGCVIDGKPEIDEGVDLTLRHTSKAHNGDGVARLEVQLKATSAFVHKTTTCVSAPMTRDRFNYFATVDPSVNKIVVILSMPAQQQYWTYARPKGLTIHHCAYWVNLAGLSPVMTETTTVHAPLSQVFDDIALCDMMERIGRGAAP
jgi:hypothetical protein